MAGESAIPGVERRKDSQLGCFAHGVDDFASGMLNDQYEWSHDPNVSQYSVSRNGVLLKTATVTDDIYQAQNTLTRRTLGPSSSATILLDFSGMHSGDGAGLSIFRDSSAWIGIAQNESSRYLNDVKPG